jgi:glucose-1-phosphate cytidylyltransferase
VNITKLIDFHRALGLQATLTATYPPSRFGSLSIQSDQRVTSFKEKPKGDGGMINGGFFVLSPKVLDLIDGDHIVWEYEPLEQLAAANQLKAYRHEGFWQCMDTLRDKNLLEELWQSNQAPWKTWQ